MTIEPIWRPSDERIASSSIMRLAARCGVDGFDGLRRLALTDLEAYWRAVIDDLGLAFRASFTQVLDLSRGPEWPRWFEGGAVNFTDTALAGGRDREGQRDDPVVLICAQEAGPTVRFTRSAVMREVAAAAARLAALGIGRGDRVALLLPNIAEAVFVTLAAARLGAIVVPLYSGFGPEPIATRLAACEAKALIACDGFLRSGQRIAVKPTIDRAVATTPVGKVALVQRLGEPVDLVPGRDVWWHQLRSSAPRDPAPDLDPNDPWLVIFTSGTTGRPKGTVHTHTGFPFRVAHDVAYQFDFAPGDRFFWYSDMGWMIGPMAICAPLMLGGALVLYDGGPATPDAMRLVEVACEIGVTHFGSSPTLLRMMAAACPTLPARLAQRLRFKTLMTAGEVIDADTFGWYHREIGLGVAPVINYTGGTEVSGGILSNVVVRPIAPGGFNAAMTDVDADVVDEEGHPVRGQIGELVIRRPMLGMTKGFWNEPGRYLESYWGKRPGLWSHGDLAICSDGDCAAREHWELRGRADDVVKVSGRRIGPSEIEEAALASGEVVAAAAIGVPDAKSGQAIVLVVVPRVAGEGEPAFAERLCAEVAARLGAGLRPKSVIAVTDLPRTRNAKILRRLVRCVVVNEPLGDISSLDNPSSLDALREAMRR